jgi:hypothetical protein
MKLIPFPGNDLTILRDCCALVIFNENEELQVIDITPGKREKTGKNAKKEYFPCLPCSFHVDKKYNLYHNETMKLKRIFSFLHFAETRHGDSQSHL